ncbi:hypothetical protein ABE65_014220 [Fictibacillus phosphorivorans]|uniref:Uncharacterized protein n=1 Tax=Fictibacillus phosphorivorans TaxID=1221500 RepID=A0A168W4I5_9BACL|nr:hypothetical protein ABE65_014220 [Fictibacillus phosphorivorans]
MGRAVRWRLLKAHCGSPKSGSDSFSPDKQKMNGHEGVLCLLDRLPFDLEGLVTATRQEAIRSPHGNPSNLERKSNSFRIVKKSSRRWELFKIYTC